MLSRPCSLAAGGSRSVVEAEHTSNKWQIACRANPPVCDPDRGERARYPVIMAPQYSSLCLSVTRFFTTAEHRGSDVLLLCDVREVLEDQSVAQGSRTSDLPKCGEILAEGKAFPVNGWALAQRKSGRRRLGLTPRRTGRSTECNFLVGFCGVTVYPLLSFYRAWLAGEQCTDAWKCPPTANARRSDTKG